MMDRRTSTNRNLRVLRHLFKILQKHVYDEEREQFQSFNPLIIGIIGGKRVRRIIERFYSDLHREKQPRVSNICQFFCNRL